MKLSASLRVSAAIAAVFASYPAAAQEFLRARSLRLFQVRKVTVSSIDIRQYV